MPNDDAGEADKVQLHERRANVKTKNTASSGFLGRCMGKIAPFSRLIEP